MNEYEVQSLVMQARNVKPADKFVMICILKNVNWTTWTGSVRLSYISKKYDVNRKTLTRITQRLRSLGWIKIKVKTDETIIEVNLNTLTSKGRDKLTMDKLTMDKMTIGEGQNDHEGMDKMTMGEGQNDHHNNNNNINTINDNEDSQEYASKQEALNHTSSQPFESLSYMVDERGKVPFHILSARHRRLEMERRWNKDDISKQDHNVFAIRRVRDTFEKKELREDFDIYDSTKPVKKTWR
jgi:hypothetical protein